MNTTQATHTPGPWKLVEHSWHNTDIFSSDDNCIASLSIGDKWDMDNQSERIAELSANARLIAAAPELLEACKEALAFFDEKWPEMNFGIPQQIRDAISKAEGRE